MAFDQQKNTSHHFLARMKSLRFPLKVARLSICDAGVSQMTETNLNEIEQKNLFVINRLFDQIWTKFARFTHNIQKEFVETSTRDENEVKRFQHRKCLAATLLTFIKHQQVNF